MNTQQTPEQSKPAVRSSDWLAILLEELDAEEARLDALIGSQRWDAEGRENEEWYRHLRRAVIALRPVFERTKERMANS